MTNRQFTLYKAVIFDLFGTLVDDFIVSAAGYNEAFSAALGVPHDAFMQQWRQITDRRTLGEFQTVEASIEHACNLCAVEVTAEQMSKAVECRLQLTRTALRPRADAISTLKELKRHGCRIGLVSNCSIEIPIVWPETEFASLFDSTVFSSRERVKKPAPEIFQLACKLLEVRPEECLYVADGENYELAAAARIGMHPVLIRTADSDNEIRREAREWRGPSISTLSEILPLIEVSGNSASKSAQ